MWGLDFYTMLAECFKQQKLTSLNQSGGKQNIPSLVSDEAKANDCKEGDWWQWYLWVLSGTAATLGYLPGADDCRLRYQFQSTGWKNQYQRPSSTGAKGFFSNSG